MGELKPCPHEVLLWNPLQNHHTCLHCLSVVTRTPPATQADDALVEAQGLLREPNAEEAIILRSRKYTMAGDYRMAYFAMAELAGLRLSKIIATTQAVSTNADLLDEIAEAISDTLDMDWQPSWAAPNIMALINRERAAAHAAGRAENYKTFTDGMEAAAQICGSLAETTYDDADAFEAATGCEAAIMRVVKDQRKEQADAIQRGQHTGADDE